LTNITTIPEIEKGLTEASETFFDFCSSLDNEKFFYQPEGKWSAAQQVKHLIISANQTRLAYTLPKFIVKLYTGKPNRPSRSYDELVQRYKTKLAQGGKASGRFVPPKIENGYGKEKLLKEFKASMTKLGNSIHKNLKEPQPDQYLCPHPLLGKVTLREMLYFTIHHNEHHLNLLIDRNK